MGGLASFAWRSLLARPVRTLLSVAGIALGVAVVLAALATSAGIEAAADRTAGDVLGRADLRVEALGEGGLSDQSIAAIEATPGVATAARQLERRTYPEVGSAAAMSDPVTVLGIDPAPDAAIHDRALVAGRGLASAQAAEALVPQRMAGAMGLAVGDSITLQGADAPRAERIVGLTAGDGPVTASGGWVVVLPIDEAMTLFGTTTVSRVEIGLAAGATTGGVTADLVRRLTAEPYVISTRAEIAASLESSTIGFRSMVALIAALALFCGALLVFNTLSMTVSERMREVGLLRAAGATRRQVTALVLRQAVALGLAGSLIGLVVGLAAAAAIAAFVSGTSIARIDGPALSASTLGLAFLVGMLVTVAASLEPAVRAGRISPIEALRPMGSGREGAARLRWLVAVVAVVGVAGIALGPPAAGSVGAVRWLAVYGTLLVATLLTPILLGPLGRLAGIPFALVAPVAARLTRGVLVRDRSRTTLTVGALTIGLALIVALSSVARDARRTASAWIESVIPGDVLVTSIRPVALDEGVAAELAAVPGVARVSPIATFPVPYLGERLDAAAVVGADMLADGRLTFLGGDRTAALNALDVTSGSAAATVVPQSVSDRFGLRLGDDLTIPLGGGRVLTLRVAGIVERTLPGAAGEAILVGWPTATGALAIAGADSFAVRYAPGAAATAGPALETAARQLALQPTSLDATAGAVDATLARVFVLLDALALVAVLVAALGIVNTLAMNVRERVRELGVLRAIGLTRRQAWRMVVVEAAVIGIVGTVIGCVAGVVVGQAMIGLASDAPVRFVFDPDWRTLASVAVFGVGTATLTAAWPARLASRMAIGRAVQFE